MNLHVDQELNQKSLKHKILDQGDLIPSALWSTTQDASTGQISLVYYF